MRTGFVGLAARWLACISAAALAALLAVPAAGADLSLNESSGFTVPVLVNGVTLKLRVDPAASGLVILNPDAVARANVEADFRRGPVGFPGWILRRAYARIGPVNLKGRTGRTTASIGGQPVDLRMIWFERDVIDDADGVISAHHLPYDSVTFELRPATGDERETRLPLAYQTEIGLYHPYRLGEVIVPVSFSVWKPASLATAAAGAYLAGGHGGSWRGDPRRQAISFGVARPVRPMELRRPIDLAGFEIDNFLVRTADHRGGYVLPAEVEDPDEIIVTANSRRGQPARMNLTVAGDLLSRCSSVTFTRATEQLLLNCARDP